MRSTAAGIWYLWQASDGVPGKDRNPVFGATGNPGGTGGKSRNATVTMFDGAVGVSVGVVAAPGAGVFAQSEGGDGGRGGKVLAGAGTATGGGRGRGGDAGGASVELGVDEGVGIEISGGAAPAVYALSKGGRGGDGGEGRTDTTGGAGSGGDGGTGGNSGSATVRLHNDNYITVDGSASGNQWRRRGREPGRRRRTRRHREQRQVGGQHPDQRQRAPRHPGGEPGRRRRRRGEGISAIIANGNGGDGGAGGSGGTVTIDVVGELSTTGDEAQGLFARSYGGNGGDGGEGSATLGRGKSGSAAGSGPGGDVSITFKGTVKTSGDAANAIFGHSVGGFGGDAAALRATLERHSVAPSAV